MLLKNPLLKHYWFYTGPHSGFGVTGYSLEDAQHLLQMAALPKHALVEIKGVIEDVDISTLDIKSDVRSHMGPPNFRGMWYPMNNLTEPLQRFPGITKIEMRKN